MYRCLICEQRPAHKATGFCHNCESKLESQRRQSKPVEPKHYLTYRGIVVGLYPDGKGKLKARLLRRDAQHLPKYKTLDLNTYLDGFSREQVKKFKACVLSLAHV